MGYLEFGVFIPIANNGWIISTTSPQYLPSFRLNREICLRAERYGFEFVLSMIKWRRRWVTTILSWVSCRRRG